MNTLFHSTAMALAEGAIRVRYVSRQFEFASFTAASSSGELTLSLGVSNTDLAAAVTAKEDIYVSSGTSDRMDDIVATIRNWRTTTSGAEVRTGDFDCELLHCIGAESPDHATVDKFEDDAGTTNSLTNAWREVLLWDNDAATGVGKVTLRLPHPAASKGGVALGAVSGALSTAGTEMANNGYIKLYHDDSTTPFYTSAITTAIGDWDNIIDNRILPVNYGEPVIVRAETIASQEAEATAIATSVTYDVLRY